MLEDRLNSLKKRMLSYVSLIKEMIRKSIDSLLNEDESLAREVITELEPKANEEEIAVEEECIALIALYQPEAKELRIVMMISKMVSDIERMGDKAVNIAESAIELIGKPKIKPYIDIPRMTEETLKMIDDSIYSFINEDVCLAYEVLKKDDIVDDLRDQILRELISFMSSDPKTIEPSLHLLRIARNLEKIADITSNICEDVVYISEGKVIKHHYPDECQS
ncbi:MAG: phosphate signaling complex protein PhoU [Brevinematia bacterium]